MSVVPKPASWAEDLATALQRRAVQVIFTGWGDRPLSHRELTGVIQEEAAPRTQGQIAADAIVPEGEDPLNWLKMCLQGYDYLLADPQPGLFTWQEARARGLRRIVAACLAVAAAYQKTDDQENPS